MVVRTNTLALNSHRNLGMVGNAQARSSARLSSGFRINSAADDAAGLGISEKMRAQIRGLDQASRNAQDGISLIQTAEGAMSTVNEMVTRIRELVVQAANDTNVGGTGPDSDRVRIQDEINQLFDEIDATTQRTEFNTRTLLSGEFAEGTQSLWFQVGANMDQGVSLHIEDISVDALDGHLDGAAVTANFGDALAAAIASQADITDADDFAGAFNLNSLRGNGVTHQSGERLQFFLSGIDTALTHVTSERSKLGAMQNRLEFTIENLDIASENLSAAESRIRDADMALEMMRLTQANVLQQAATAMLAQANQAPQSILQLLG